MECGIIDKTDLDKLIASASERSVRFYAPVDGENGPELRPVAGHEEIAFDYGNARLSSKSLLFPQREVLGKFTNDTAEQMEIDAEESILFGIRPCDAFALSCLDKVFSDESGRFQDPYYLTRRAKALIISLACDAPRATCFCTSVGGSPSGKRGADILVSDLGEKLLFESATEKGEAFIRSFKLFATPSDEEVRIRDEKALKAEQSMTKIPIPDMEALPGKLTAEFEEPLWDTITQNCLGCGACTYLCPTCHCFDITDETNAKGDGIRLRTWDSCQYPLFTLHASGHNPRTNKKQRLRQRIMHKFSYSVENTGDIFCVGCGRCVTNCPVGLDIREMLTSLDKM